MDNARSRQAQLQALQGLITVLMLQTLSVEIGLFSKTPNNSILS